MVLARLGLASRRGVVSLIESGQVKVNGTVILEKGHRVFPGKDVVQVEGRELPAGTREAKRYFMLNKPKGVMTTLQDPHAERTVVDFFKGIPERLFPVGRLDRDTTGLLLLTNDGELAFRLTHPKFGVQKKYRTRVQGVVTEEQAKRLEKGVVLEEGKTAPCRVQIDEKSARETHLTVTLGEGKKRQIRRIFESIGHRVLELERLHYGPLALGDLRPGQRRELKPHEVRQLQQAVGLAKSTPKK